MKWNVYLRGKDYTRSTFDLVLERKQGRLYHASGKIVGIPESEYNALTKKDEITIRSIRSEKNNFQGEMMLVEWDSLRRNLQFEAYNFPAKFNDLVWEGEAKEWQNTEFQTIISEIFDKYAWDTFEFDPDSNIIGTDSET